MVAELRQVDPSRVATTTEAPATETLPTVPASPAVLSAVTTTTQSNVAAKNASSSPGNADERFERLVSENATTTTLAPVIDITTSSPVIAAMLREVKTELPSSVEQESVGELLVPQSSETTTGPTSSAQESQTIPNNPAPEESGSGEIATTLSTNGAESITWFDLNR